MLGHKLWQELRDRMETYVTVRQSAGAYAHLGIFTNARLIDRVDARSPHDLHRAFGVALPDVVINAVGIVKQLKEAHDPVASIEANALLPHTLEALCTACAARLVHVSTDCVFSGLRGHYVEGDQPDPIDLYGRSKLLGEVAGRTAVTIRTSMIGRELGRGTGLLEWFLAQRGRSVRGFRRAIYSGFTTRELARVLADIAERHVALTGVWQVSSDAISKYELLHLINDAFALGVRIEPDDEFVCDRSLDSSRYRARTGYRPPSWAEMVGELRTDPTPYDQWKTT